MTGLSDHDALAQLIERADHRGRGIDGNVIGEYQPGRRIDLAAYRRARRRRWLAPDQHSPGGDRVVIAERNHLLKAGVEDGPLPIALAYVIGGHSEDEIRENRTPSGPSAGEARLV